MTLLVLGAYALLAGLDPHDLPRAYAALADLEADALEVPLADALGAGTIGPQGASGLPALLTERWDVVVTAIPTVMRALAHDPRYGLASTDEDGRRAAVAHVRQALALARRAAEHAGRPRVRAVEVHSAPGPRGRRDRDALLRSLEELLAVPAAGAHLVVEHCDAARPGRAAEKGFLELRDEIEVLTVVGDPRARLAVNWGRSAIEGRSIRTPVEHVASAAAAGVLDGVMFSGVAPVAGPWGEAWSDGHPAPRTGDAELDAAPECLLGPQEVAVTLAAADPCPPAYVGMKITVGDGTATPDRRVAVARAALALLADVAPARERTPRATTGRG